MATIENLPLELIDNPIAEESSLFKYILNKTDILNCSEALIGTRHEEYVTQKFLKPQLKIFATLPSLNNSLKNEGWFEGCEDTKLIVKLCKEFKPSLPGKIFLINIRDSYLLSSFILKGLFNRFWIKEFALKKLICQLSLKKC